jgi:hypothetical protein
MPSGAALFEHTLSTSKPACWQKLRGHWMGDGAGITLEGVLTRDYLWQASHDLAAEGDGCVVLDRSSIVL